MPRYIRSTAKTKLTAVVIPAEAFVQSIPFRVYVPLSGRTTSAYRLRGRGRSNTKSYFFSNSVSRLKTDEIEPAADTRKRLQVSNKNSNKRYSRVYEVSRSEEHTSELQSRQY